MTKREGNFLDEPLDIRTRARNHGGSVKGKSQRIRCYTGSSFVRFIPSGYVLTGECLAAEISADDKPVLSPPKTYSRWKYAEKGYWNCGGNQYVALMQSGTADEAAVAAAAAAFTVCAVLTVAFWPKIEAGLPVFTPESSVVLDPNAQEYVGEKPNPNKGQSRRGQYTDSRL